LEYFLGQLPRWTNKPVERFWVTRDRRNKALTVKLKPVGGRRWITVSWRKCAIAHHKAIYPRTTGAVSNVQMPIDTTQRDLDSAMRYAVRRQVSLWKYKHRVGASCVSCNIASRLEADHVVPFKKLKDDYLGRCRTVPIVFLWTRGCQRKFAKCDTRFCRSWQRSHAKNAIFQWLCRHCNASKGCKVPLTSLKRQ